uniref:homeobox protein Hox-A3 n=1 Tax=Maylandia zebra TaxID=106582 RepID=UPI000D3037A9|nr:homeobox protein Hox-A3-like [Maylandia zebra]
MSFCAADRGMVTRSELISTLKEVLLVLNQSTSYPQAADEGLYCSTDQGGKSPQSSLRVRDPPKIIHPPPPSTSTNFAPPLTCPPSPPLPASTCPPPPSLVVPVVAGLGSGLLLVLGLVLFLCWKLKGTGAMKRSV